MTALQEYHKLEATALWRTAESDQRREVIVSVGDATLQIFDGNGKALGHWSLAAVVVRHQTDESTVFSPGDDISEELEIDDAEMIAAITRVHKAVDERRPPDGRWSARASFAIVAATIALLVFWVPGALSRYAIGIVPTEVRLTTSDRLMTEIVRISGLPCTIPESEHIADALSERLALGFGNSFDFLPSGLTTTAILPDGRVLLNRTLVEDYETPDVLAGYLVETDLRRETVDPLGTLLKRGGVTEALRLITTGQLSDKTLRRYAQSLLTDEPPTVDFADLADRLNAIDVAGGPFARAVDFSGKTTSVLIAEGDAMESREILSDGDWVALQGVCGE